MENKKTSVTKRIFQVVFLILLIAGSVWVIRNQQAMPYQHDKGYIFGTVYDITYQSGQNLQSEIEKELNKVDASLSTFNSNSVISKVNNNENLVVDEMFKEVFELAREVSESTDGAFDITVSPLVNAWGFGFENDVRPTPHDIDSLLDFVGYEKVRLVNNRVVKQDKRLMLDCSGIAKGYGCDVVARFLKSRDIKNFMVEIGGEVVTNGISDKRQPWKIGVSKPVDDSTQVSGSYETILNVTDKAMATSGNYRKFYYKNGKKYAHTIDPATGYPVQHNILSATVLAKNCATADAFATAFMVLGLEKTRQVLRKHPGLMVYLIYSDGNNQNQVWFSPSLKGKIIK